MSLEQMLKQHTEQDAANFEDLKADVSAMRSEITEIRVALASQKSFIGGIVVTVSAIFTVIGLAIAYFRG